MKTIIQKKLLQLSTWLRETTRSDYHSEIENYLHQSVDAADLEHRIRMLRERGYAL